MGRPAHTEEGRQPGRTGRGVKDAAAEDERDARNAIAEVPKHRGEHHVRENKDCADETGGRVGQTKATVEPAVGRGRLLQLIEHGRDGPAVHVLQQRNGKEQSQRRIVPARLAAGAAVRPRRHGSQSASDGARAQSCARAGTLGTPPLVCGAFLDI